MTPIQFHNYISELGVIQIGRANGYRQSVYKNPKNSRIVTIPCYDPLLSRDYVRLVCHWLEVEDISDLGKE